MRIETRAREIVNTADLFAGYQAAHARLWGAPPLPVAIVEPELPVVAPPRVRTIIICIGDDAYARLLVAWGGGPIKTAPKPAIPLAKIEDIQRAVARHYSITRFDLMSERRTINVVRPRQIAMYLARTLTLRSMPEIGRRFGGRDHTTVLHAVRRIAELILVNAVMAADVAALIVACGGLPE